MDTTGLDAYIDRSRLPTAERERSILALVQAISSETARERILQVLTRLLVEESGARSASFLSLRDGRWRNECSAGPPPHVPDAIVDRVVKTRERALVEAPSATDGARPISMLCLPVLRHGALAGVVHLEGERSLELSRERLERVELLVHEAAVSLETASLLAAQRRERNDRQQAEATLRAILDNLVDAVVICDRTGRITFGNLAWERVFSHHDPRTGFVASPEEFVRVARPEHPDGSPFTVDELPLCRALAGEVLSGIDMTLRSTEIGRAVHLRLSAAPLQDERGALAGAVLVSVNVTDAVELDRLKEQFIRVVAHELKTPVAIVKGYTDILRHIDEPLGKHRRLLDALIRGTDRIDRLVTELLLMWQLQTGRLALAAEPGIDLVELVHLVTARFERPTVLRVEVVSSPVIITADRQLIETAVTALVDNALRYSPAGRQVNVRVGKIGQLAFIDVEDHGIGIPEDKQHDVFEPFYRAHAETPYDSGGLGLGLYVTRAIAAMHGGSVVLASREGEGSTFHVTIPVEVTSPAKEAAHGA